MTNPIPRPESPRIPLPPLLGLVARVGIDELHRCFAAEGFQGIGLAHGSVFRFIDAERGSRLTELARRAGITKQSLGEVADDLERLGYVERVPDPSDRRAKIVRLTERGQQAHAAGVRIFADIERRWAARYGDDRLATLRDVLEDILADARRATDD